MKEELIQLTFQINEPQQLLRDAIRQYGISKKALTSIKYEGGKITVNGEEKTVRHRLDVGDTVMITFPPEKKVAD